MIRVVACLHGLLAETGGFIVADIVRHWDWMLVLSTGICIDIVNFYLRAPRLKLRPSIRLLEKFVRIVSVFLYKLFPYTEKIYLNLFYFIYEI